MYASCAAHVLAPMMGMALMAANLAAPAASAAL